MLFAKIYQKFKSFLYYMNEHTHKNWDSKKILLKTCLEKNFDTGIVKNSEDSVLGAKNCLVNNRVYSFDCKPESEAIIVIYYYYLYATFTERCMIVF